MKPRSLSALAAVIAAALPLPAEEPVEKVAGEATPSVVTVPGATPATTIAVGSLRSDTELDELLGPIALYPDALIALILPATSRSTEIVLAARYLRDGGTTEAIDGQPWDESVRALAHYPEVIKWLDSNLAWTAQVGEAFLAQPAEVMKSVQRLRARARAAGTLTDTPQQKVLVEEREVIRIVPADPEIIYVPRYDPDIVFIERRTYYPEPFLTFGFGYTVGSWLSYDCDWRYSRLHVIDRGWNWRSQPSWCYRRFYHGPVFQPAYWRPWTPPRVHVRHDPPGRSHPRPAPVRPTRFVDHDRSRPPHLDQNRPDRDGRPDFGRPGRDTRPDRDGRPDFERPGRRPGTVGSDNLVAGNRHPGLPATRRGSQPPSSVAGFTGAPVVPPVATPVVPPVSSEVFVPSTTTASTTRVDSGRRRYDPDSGTRRNVRPPEGDSAQRFHRPPPAGSRATVPSTPPSRAPQTMSWAPAPSTGQAQTPSYRPSAPSRASSPAPAYRAPQRHQDSGATGSYRAPERQQGSSGTSSYRAPERPQGSGSVSSYRSRSEPSGSGGERSRGVPTGESGSRPERSRFDR